MAFQIDPNIPLQANKVQFDPASILMQAQNNAANLEKHRFEMQKLREDYDAQKEARLRQKQMQQGIASDLAAIQSGTPAQYAPTRFEQTPQRGQMPMGMTGVLASERGQNMPSPDLFGENILKGNFRLGGGEVTQEAVAGREPSYTEMLQIGFKNAMLAKDAESAFKYAAAIKQQQQADRELNAPIGNPYARYDDKGAFVGTYVMTKSGEVPFGQQGTTTVKPDVMTAYQKEQAQIERDKMAQEAELARLERESKLNKPDPVTQALAIAQGKEDIRLAAEQRAKVAEKYADASTAIDLLDDYITTAEKAPKTGAGEYIERGLGFFGGGNKEQQTAMGAMAQKAAALVTLAQKQTGPQSDKDVQNYKEQMGVIANAPNLEMKIAAAKAAKGFAQRIQQKYGSYASDILSGKVTPDELKARQESVNNGSQAPDLSRLPTANIEKGSVAKDPKTGKPIAMFNGSKWIPWGGK